MALEKISGAEFQSAVIESPLPVLVDFSATWCGPCRVLEPIVKELSEAFSGKVKFFKVDIDESAEVAEQYAVSVVPTLLLVNNGEEADRKTGVLPKPALESWINSHAG